MSSGVIVYGGGALGFDDSFATRRLATMGGALRSVEDGVDDVGVMGPAEGDAATGADHAGPAPPAPSDDAVVLVVEAFPSEEDGAAADTAPDPSTCVFFSFSISRVNRSSVLR